MHFQFTHFKFTPYEFIIFLASKNISHGNLFRTAFRFCSSLVFSMSSMLLNNIQMNLGFHLSIFMLLKFIIFSSLWLILLNFLFLSSNVEHVYNLSNFILFFDP